MIPILRWCGARRSRGNRERFRGGGSRQATEFVVGASEEEDGTVWELVRAGREKAMVVASEVDVAARVAGHPITQLNHKSLHIIFCNDYHSGKLITATVDGLAGESPQKEPCAYDLLLQSHQYHN